VPAAATLDTFLDESRRRVDEALDRYLPVPPACPPVLSEAMRYSVFAGGKRLRPILTLAAADAVARSTGSTQDVASHLALPAACAIELIHTYSLIHDDLPALDNDDLRRGQPTCHKQFGEATAILAGDALLTLAFETLANAPVEYGRRVALIAEIAAAAGTRDGMVGGQVADLESEGQTVTADGLAYIHRSKTAALIRASIVSGAIAGGAEDADLARLRSFGDLIGWAFQVTDDILDVEESSATLGKTAGKDQAQRKATYPALFGLAKSHEFARDLATRAIAELEPYGVRAQHLRELGDFLVLRRT
jgi:geranylgeranyl diphosphate synthase type II